MSIEMVKAVLERESAGSAQNFRVVTRANQEFFGPIVSLSLCDSQSQAFIEMQDFTPGPNPGYPVFISCAEISSIQMPHYYHRN